MDKKMIKIERAKIKKLLDTAQQKLDSAKESKAPQSTIKFLEQRVEALGSQLAKWDNFKAPKPKASSDGEQEEESATKPEVEKQKGKKTSKR